MATNKTTENHNSVADFISTIANEKKRSDFSALVDFFAKQTGFPPKMWGTAIVGFGSYHYKYASGHEGDAPLAGLAARANAITLYFSDEYEGRETFLAQLGKHKSSKACVYIQKLEDINTGVLGKMIKNSIEHTLELYPAVK